MSFRAAVKNVLEDLVDERYPHIRRSGAAYARVTSVSAIGAETWVYGLRLLRFDMAVDSMVPEIPGIKSKVELKQGDLAAVVFPYGRLQPFIVGEAIL